VDDVSLVGGLDRPGQRLRQPGRLARRQRRALQLPVEAAAGAELQGQVGPALVDADLEDLDDVRMLQAGDGFRLGLEALQGGAAGVSAGQDHLEGDDPVEAHLPGPIHHAHAAAPQLAEDLVARRRAPFAGGVLRRRWVAVGRQDGGRRQRGLLRRHGGGRQRRRSGLVAGADDRRRGVGHGCLRAADRLRGRRRPGGESSITTVRVEVSKKARGAASQDSPQRTQRVPRRQEERMVFLPPLCPSRPLW
jgi:hypothetical protein